MKEHLDANGRVQQLHQLHQTTKYVRQRLAPRVPKHTKVDWTQCQGGGGLSVLTGVGEQRDLLRRVAG